MNRIEEHYKKTKKRNDRIEQLKDDINTSQSYLVKIESDYKQSVIENADNIDDLFHEMEKLKGKIKADKHKLSTLKEVTQEHAIHDAVETANHFLQVKDDYIEKGKKIVAELEKAKREYIDKLGALDKFHSEYKQVQSKYYNLLKRYDLHDPDKNKGKINSSLVRSIEKELYTIPNRYDMTITSEDIRKAVN